MLEDSQSEASVENAGSGQDQPEVVWDRWAKKRTFFRALEGTYGEMKQGLYDQKPVFSTNDMEWKGGPQAYGKRVINPKDIQVAQSIETHFMYLCRGVRTKPRTYEYCDILCHAGCGAMSSMTVTELTMKLATCCWLIRDVYSNITMHLMMRK